MGSVIKTFRLLKKEQPDKARVEKVFAKKDDQVLLGAIANPEHSEAAVQILRKLAGDRGIADEIEEHWAQTEEAMYIPPFGKKPFFEDVFAAPGRRRRVYRSLQGFMLACLLVAGWCFFYYDPFPGWIKEGVEAGEVNPVVVSQFSDQSPPPSQEKIYNYLHGLNIFASELRQNYLNKLVEYSILDSEQMQQLNQSRAVGKDTVSRKIIGSVGTMSSASDSLAVNTKILKEEAYLQTIDSFVIRNEAAAELDALDQPPDYIYTKGFMDLVETPVKHIVESEGGAADEFDYFAQSATFEPHGSRAATPEMIGLGLLVVGLLVWLFGGIFSWLRPYRMLLLRPFQSKEVSRPLKRFIKKNVSFYGHITTLADKYIKESKLEFIVFWIPRSIPEIFLIILYMFPPIRQFKRYIKVGSASSYQFLRKRLARRFTMNMFWQNSFSGDKLLKVKCSDTWWKQCVDLLMYSSHLIVVDLSWVKVGTEWELDKINSRDLEQKTVFVVGEDAADYAREVVEKFWPAEEAPPVLHVYKRSGKLLDDDAFGKDVARIISGSHLWDVKTAD